MPDDIDWTLTTWEGNRRRQHAEFRALPFREKLVILEQMSEVTAALIGKRELPEVRNHSRHGGQDR